MKLSTLVPKPTAVVTEALVVIGGAILAAVVISQVPALRDWIKKQWADTPNPLNPWQ